MNESNSGVNTVLLILILVLVVSGIVWFLREPVAEDQDNASIEVSIPTGGDSSSDNSN